jgi:Catalase
MKRTKLITLILATTTIAAAVGAASRLPEPKDFSALLNFDLSPGESWKGGSKAAEIASFMLNAMDVRRASAKLFHDNAGVARSGRVFHEKQHGCLTGTLTIRGERPEDTDGRTVAGLFAKEASYPVIARFSNGIGGVGHDADPDVRGLAIKMFGEDGQPVDFLMTNSTNPLGRDLQQFVDFMNAQVQGNLEVVRFVREQVASQSDPDELPYLRHFTRTVLGVIESPEKEAYWSGHPYMMGAGSHMKFNVRPEGWSDEDQFKYDHRGEGVGLLELPGILLNTAISHLTKSPNYLRESLLARAKAAPIHYVFSLQLEKDASSTPLENALVEWKESDAPSIPVADLVLDQQDFSEQGREAECGRLRFTPAHYHPEHRPVGNMGRGRLFAYLASQIARGADDYSPDAGIVDRWRNHRYSQNRQ